MDKADTPSSESSSSSDTNSHRSRNMRDSKFVPLRYLPLALCPSKPIPEYMVRRCRNDPRWNAASLAAEGPDRCRSPGSPSWRCFACPSEGMASPQPRHEIKYNYLFFDRTRLKSGRGVPVEPCKVSLSHITLSLYIKCCALPALPCERRAPSLYLAGTSKCVLAAIRPSVTKKHNSKNSRTKTTTKNNIESGAYRVSCHAKISDSHTKRRLLH